MSAPTFDFMAPLPVMALPVNRSWEPAARHYIDLTDNEKMEQGVMHNVMHISEVLAETFKVAPTPENLTAWVDSQPPTIPTFGSTTGAHWKEQPMVGQGLLFCDEVNTEFVK